MSEKLKIILVGLGQMGQKWINIIQNSDEVICVGYVENNNHLLEVVSKKYNLPKELLFNDLETAAKCNTADFIINVTPPAIHKEIGLKAFEYGLHVLSEKPIADTLESAIDIYNHVRQTDLKYMISQDYRFNNGTKTVYELLNNNKIGQLGHIDLRFSRYPNFEPSNFRLTELEYPMIVDMSIHHFDLMRYFTKSNPKRITTRSYNPKWSQYSGDAAHSIILEFDGFHINYSGTWSARGPQTNRPGIWQLDGSEGSLIWDGLNVVTLHHYKDFKETQRDIPLIDLKHQAQAYSLSEFVDSIKNNRTPNCSIEDNLLSFAMVFCAIESAKRREEVFFEEILENMQEGSMV